MGARHASVAGIVRSLTVLAAVGGLSALAGCSGDDDGKDKGAAPAGVSDTTTASLPKGDEATYLKAIRALDAKLVGDEKTALDNGYNLCQDKANGMTTSEMADDAISLFQTDVRKAQKIVAITQTNLCR